ncbi:MAG: phospholipase D-like domain-containing protein [Myxococcota bacterium]
MTPVDSLAAAYSLLPGPSQHGEVRLLLDNEEAWLARWHLIASAQTQIDVAYFIVEDDEFGLAFLGHLYQRAKDGIQVRLLIDARGSYHFASLFPRHPLLRALVATGHADVRLYNPPLGRITDALVSASLIPAIASNHDKILIADGQHAIVGGRNIANHYFEDRRNAATFDVDLLIRSQGTAAELQNLFLDEFDSRRIESISTSGIASPEAILLLQQHFEREESRIQSKRNIQFPYDPPGADRLWPRSPSDLDSAGADSATTTENRPRITTIKEGPALQVSTADIRILRSGSRATESGREVATGVLQAISGARRTIYIETPYLILTKDMLQVLMGAAERGVHISILTNGPSSSDNSASQAFFIDDWPELMDRIPTLQLFVVTSKSLMHAKRIIVDDQLTLIGTFNLDPLSARVNSEIIAAAWSQDFATLNRSSLEQRLNSSDIIEYKIFRTTSGRAIRYPSGHRDHGKIMIHTGPSSHTAADSIERLRWLRGLLSIIAGVIDFTPVRF